MRCNWWLIGLTLAAILAVIFSIGTMQLFRLLRSVGALRVLRVKKVANAGQSLANKGRSQRHQRLGKVLATVVVAVFVSLALAVAESDARTFLEDFVGEEGAIAAAVVAGLLTMTVMYFLVRTPQKQRTDESQDRSSASRSG